MCNQFVDGWTIMQVLGEGAFGEVKLLVNDETNDALAVKTINIKLHQEARMLVRKEIAIHRLLNHENIIKYFGHRSEADFEYIFLEYASGGELFDKIEPDKGMSQSLAQKYFTQIVSAIEYLHSHGVAHRDIKPENILLSASDDVKLSDFGMATMFRKNGIERLLDRKCGTMPYVAPEVLEKPYSAVPADIWSCGIVLVALLAGELPWDSPTEDCNEYSLWKKNSLIMSPWNKMDTLALNLMKKILSPQSMKRPDTKEILQHRWCTSKLSKESESKQPSLPNTKRLNTGIETPPSRPEDVLSATQPMPRATKFADIQIAANEEERFICFSQPALLDDLLLSSQLNATQVSSLSTYQKLVRRMTRFLVDLKIDAAVARLCDILEKMGCISKIGPPMVITTTTTDRRKNSLVFKANLAEMEERLLIDFRLSKGDGLEFKKMFLKIRKEMEDVIVKKPCNWL